VLIEILKRSEAIGAEKERVLQSRSGCAGMFLQKAKQIDGEIEQLRSSTAHPRAVETVIQGLSSARAAGEYGQVLVGTVRERVLKDSSELEVTLAELQYYPVAFQHLIDVAHLYASGLAEPADYAQMVKAVWKARDHLRSIVYALAQAAEAAEMAVKKLPSLPSGPATPLSHIPAGTPKEASTL
jgi:hypothetical protein